MIIGTSNSLVHAGYVSALRPPFSLVINLAIGGCMSVLHAFRRPDIAQTRNATAIYDFAVNETNLFLKLSLSRATQRDCFKSFLGVCGDQQLTPLVLIMPCYWEAARNGPVRDAYIAFAKEHRLPWFDGFVYNERLYDVMPELRSHGFVGQAHVDLIIARMIGRAIATGMAKVQAEHPVSWVAAQNIASVEAIFPADYLPRERLTDRKPRHDDRRFTAIVEPGRAIELPVQPGDQIVGMAINSSHSNGVVKLSTGAVTRTRATQTHFCGQRYRILVWPFSEPIPTAEGAVRIECLEPGAEADEINELLTDDVHSWTSVEVAALIVRRTRAEAFFPALDRPVDIVAELSDAEILEQARAEIEATAAAKVARAEQEALEYLAAMERAERMAAATAERHRVAQARAAHQEELARKKAARVAAFEETARINAEKTAAAAKAREEATNEKAARQAAKLAAAEAAAAERRQRAEARARAIEAEREQARIERERIAAARAVAFEAAQQQASDAKAARTAALEEAERQRAAGEAARRSAAEVRAREQEEKARARAAALEAAAQEAERRRVVKEEEAARAREAKATREQQAAIERAMKETARAAEVADAARAKAAKEAARAEKEAARAAKLEEAARKEAAREARIKEGARIRAEKEAAREASARTKAAKIAAREAKAAARATRERQKAERPSFLRRVGQQLRRLVRRPKKRA